MRTPLVAANWKMNKTVEEARSLVYSMSARLREIKGAQIVLCPPFTALLAVHALLEGSDMGLGAQNMYWEEKGAYTGEVSPLMVKELCQYVILGHSERRAYFGETDETVNRRIRAAQKFDLTPIFCIGETLNNMKESRQVRSLLARSSAALQMWLPSCRRVLLWHMNRCGPLGPGRPRALKTRMMLSTT